MAKDYYELLGVQRGATDKEIRQAFRKLARQYHPDVNRANPDAEERFKEISAAYEVLSDGDSRAKYDRYGEQWKYADQIEETRRKQGAAGFGGFSPFGAGGGSQRLEFDLNDLGEMDDGAGGIFESLLGRGGGRRRGQDVEYAATISLEEAYRGTKRTIEIPDGPAETCRVCGGAGNLAGATCHACRGSGVAQALRRIEVTIPAGVRTGTRIRVPGKGRAGARGGQAGDLFVRVEVRPHPRFELRGDDLQVEVDVPVADAALGGEVEVPTLKGRPLALTIPPGTQAGKTFRLAGQGMPKRGGGFGDLHVKVQLRLPEPMTDEQRQLFERLRETTRGERSEAAS